MPAGPISVSQYHQMIKTGVLRCGDPCELLEGWIVAKPRRSSPHEVTINLVDDAIRRVLPAVWRLRVNSAITTENSEPESDMAVILGPPRRYMDRHPGPADIGLLAEVADRSLDFDRGPRG